MSAPADDLPRPGAGIDEWIFAAWLPDASLGLVSGHRLVGDPRRAWYWFGFVQAGHPLLQITEWDVRLRADPFIVKAPEMWAEHHCVAPLDQWTLGNEAHAVALDDPAEALGRGYGVPTAMSIDVEWYATGPAAPVADGFVQEGVAHGIVELIDRADVELVEAPARRWRRWTDGARLDPVGLDQVRAHTGLRAPFAFPDGCVTDWVLTGDGWRAR